MKKTIRKKGNKTKKLISEWRRVENRNKHEKKDRKAKKITRG